MRYLLLALAFFAYPAHAGSMKNGALGILWGSSLQHLQENNSLICNPPEQDGRRLTLDCGFLSKYNESRVVLHLYENKTTAFMLSLNTVADCMEHFTDLRTTLGVGETHSERHVAMTWTQEDVFVRFADNGRGYCYTFYHHDRLTEKGRKDNKQQK